MPYTSYESIKKHKYDYCTRPSYVRSVVVINNPVTKKYARVESASAGFKNLWNLPSDRTVRSVRTRFQAFAFKTKFLSSLYRTAQRKRAEEEEEEDDECMDKQSHDDKEEIEDVDAPRRLSKQEASHQKRVLLELPACGDARLSYCKSCFGRGRVACGACEGTGVENNWLYEPARDGGWGPRGEWLDADNPPPPQ